MSAARDLEEDDGGGGSVFDQGYVPPQQPNSLPAGLSGIDLPPPAPPQQGGRQQPQAPEYDIIETDSSGKPLQQPAGQEQFRPEQDDSAQQTEAEEQGRFRDDRNSAQRRARQRQGKERTIAENARLHAEVREQQRLIAELHAKFAGIEPRLSQIDQAQVQNQLAGLERQIDAEAQRAGVARRRIAEAMTNQDADALTTALDERDQAIIAGQRLLTQKNLLANGHVQQQGQQQTAPPAQQQPQQPPPVRPLSPAARAFADDFTAAYPWLNGNDPDDFDSQLVLRIDSKVASENYDPSTQDYWDEIEDRMRRYLPHRFTDPRQSQQQPAQPRQAPPPRQQAAQQPPERRGPMVSGSSDRPPAGAGRQQVYLSPERKDALMAAGVLERDGRTVTDKTKFGRYMEQFAKFDREHGVARQ